MLAWLRYSPARRGSVKLLAAVPMTTVHVQSCVITDLQIRSWRVWSVAVPLTAMYSCAQTSRVVAVYPF
jgi:hypothetical protein